MLGSLQLVPDEATAQFMLHVHEHLRGEVTLAAALHRARAALDVGFGSYVQFHRAFKQVVGHPPAHHLQLVRGGVVDPSRTGAPAG